MHESGLSRAELDALMELVEKPRGGNSRPYEFGEPERLPARGLARIEAALDRAGQAALKPLALLLRQQPFLGPTVLTETIGRTFLGDLGESDFLYALTAPTGETGLLTIERRLGSAIVDRLLGGRGEASKQVASPTEAELALIRHFAETLVSGLGPEFKALGVGGWQLGPREPSPRLTTLVVAREILLSATFDLACGEVSGRIRIALPTRALGGGEPAEERLQPRCELSPTHPLSSLPLSVAAVLETVELPLRSLLELEPGDVLRLSRRLDAPIELHVAGVPKLHALAGCRAGQRVVQIHADDESAPQEEGVGAWQAA
ncbi:MAG: FliM/FliN family flagellar motor switch protein [Planctomycetes bacterium]|nr:FliM/FliN family flagellar motor switch protein [Planctomycetota bacterium]